MTFKHRVFRIIEAGSPGDTLSVLFDVFMVVLIVTNALAAVLATVDTIHARHADALQAFEIISVVIFTLEYAARLWVCREHVYLREMDPVTARLRFAARPLSIVDLLAILPFYVALLTPLGAADFRILRLFRLLRLLKLARYSPAMATLGRVLLSERRAIAAALLVMLCLITGAATVLYLVERSVQPEVLGSVPAAMWWAVATLTTVGYGDVAPITAPGKMIGAVVMIMGVGMFALPIAIVASGFADEIHRRDFVITWGTVARVPIFARLDALSVARIVELLRARIVPPGQIIARRGERADAIYFIASGEVEMMIEPEPVFLREGEFFGEIGLLNQAEERTATARALTRCRLMVLEADDFHGLMETNPDLRAAIERIAAERLEQSEQHHAG